MVMVVKGALSGDLFFQRIPVRPDSRLRGVRHVRGLLREGSGPLSDLVRALEVRGEARHEHAGGDGISGKAQALRSASCRRS
jgi:hypothetical protein